MRHTAFFWAVALSAAVLVNCTLLSFFVEDQMTVLVSPVSARPDYENGCSRIALDAVKTGPDGSACLYAIREGQGLSSGLWAEVSPTNVLGVDEGSALVLADQGQPYVKFSSRPLQGGERIRETEEQDPCSDTFLLVVTEDLSLPPEALTGGGFALLPQETVTQPFLKEREVSQLFGTGAQVQLFSLREVEDFAAALPWASLAGALVLLTLFCAVGFCRAFPNKLRALFWAGGCVLLWAGLWLVLGRLQLPSSLLPAENLLDFSHYRETFSQIAAGLEAFPQDAACARTLEALTGNARLCLGALIGFGAILVLLLALSFTLQHRKSPAGRHFSRR